MRFITILPILLALWGCSTPEGANVPEGTREFTNDLRSGPSSSASSTDEVRAIVGGSQLGDVEQDNIDARATRNVSQTSGAPVQMGFTLGVAGTTVDSIAKAVDADPTVAALQTQLEIALAEDPPDQGRLTYLTGELTAAVDRARAAMNKAGGDLSSLTHLTVVNTSTNLTGADPKSITPEEARAAANGPAQIVREAKKSR